MIDHEITALECEAMLVSIRDFFQARGDVEERDAYESHPLIDLDTEDQISSGATTGIDRSRARA